jgi:hypothetical protein
MGIASWKKAVVAAAGVLALGAPIVGVATGQSPAGAVTPHDVTVSSSNVQFPDTTLGDYTQASVTLTNTSSTQTVTVAGNTATGADLNDFSTFPDLGCQYLDQYDDPVLPPGASCNINLYFFPGALGNRSADLTFVGGATDDGSADDNGTTPLASVAVSGNGTIGYYQVDAYGDVANFGDASWYGDMGQDNLNSPIVGMAQTGDTGGYWLAARDGGVFNFGDAMFSGSMGGKPLNKPIVGVAADMGAPTPKAYWLVASDGGIFNFGGAPFYGSTGSIALNKPIVGMAPTTDDAGYWLVASDGGIFAYGDAQFHGSTGSMHLNQPIVGMAPTPDDNGYWLVAADGGIFAFGDAQFYGSTGALHLVQPITAMAAMPDGGGYWFTATDGGLFNYGTAPFYGAANSQGLSDVVGMASDGAPTPQAASGIPALRHASDRSGGWSGPPSGYKLQKSP